LIESEVASVVPGTAVALSVIRPVLSRHRHELCHSA
jgi:hypothetical protein